MPGHKFAPTSAQNAAAAAAAYDRIAFITCEDVEGASDVLAFALGRRHGSKRPDPSRDTPGKSSMVTHYLLNFFLLICYEWVDQWQQYFPSWSAWVSLQGGRRVPRSEPDMVAAGLHKKAVCGAG
jgi:hypothetical protein